MNDSVTRGRRPCRSAPQKIDPRLLDHRHLFAEYEGPKQTIDVLSHQKQKKNRSGYEDGVTTLYKVGWVGYYTFELVFDP